MLTIVVPGLLVPAGAPEEMRGARLPAIEHWLARARLEHAPAAGTTGWLAEAWGLPQPAPIAAVELAEVEATQPGTWLRADPVHLRVEGDGTVLHPPAHLELTAEEAAELVGTLNASLGEVGIAFHAPHPERWYARVPEGEVPETTPLEAALGRNPYGLLPRGSGRINWPSLVTEAQMLLYTHPVNERREAEVELTANSVWFWGGGALPERVERAFLTVYADDPFARGLAHAAKVRSRPLPASLADVASPGPEPTLVVVDRLVASMHAGNELEWTEAAREIDAAWFAPLGEAIRRFGAVRLVLPGPERTLVAALGRGSRWRIFGTRRPLASHA